MNLNDLNKEQRAAAETLEGPLLVLAGAGSGKTRMLTYRIANLINHGVAPYHIMAITFTNKAAAEMRDRVSQLVGGEEGKQVWVSTFHAACARILRRDIEKLGYKRNFAIYDESDQDSVLKDIMNRMNIDTDQFPIKSIKTKISHAKEKLLTPQEWLAEEGETYLDETVCEIFTKYEERLKENNALDFNDLIVRTLELLTMHPPVLQYYHHTLRYFHVDEYQDTNYAQYQLIRLLSEEERNLCVVGDDDQSIYAWRGADIRNILNFQSDFPEAKVVKLEENYRSTANILDAANQVIAGNESRMDKSLWTRREAGEKITYVEVPGEREEAIWIANTIERLHAAGTSFSDITILYRTNAQSRPLEDIFPSRGIPYRIYGGLKFYDRKEIKDATAYLKLLLNPTDDVALRRIINVPRRAIGEVTITALMDYAASEGIPAMSACMSLPDDFNKRAKKKIEEFAQLMMRMTMEMEKRSTADFVKYVIEETGIRQEYINEDSDDARSRLENLDQLVNSVTEFTEHAPNSTLLDFLETTSLESSFDTIDENAGIVTMMTLHGAKGLEFPIVFMAGMDENTFPSYRAIQNDDNVEEERRLCYVGITRAKDKLYMSHVMRRRKWTDYVDVDPSRFIEDIPPRLIEEVFATDVQAGFGRNGQRGYGRNMLDELNFENGTQWKTTMRQGSMGRAGGFGGGNAVNINGRTIPGVQRGFGGTPAGQPGQGKTAAGFGTQGQPAGQTRVSSAAAGFGKVKYVVGDKIMHRKFGRGQVTEIRQSDGNERLIIRFDNGQVKELQTDMAPIVKMEE